MLLKIGARIWRSDLDFLEKELNRKLTERQRQTVLLEIQEIILSFIKEKGLLDILILRPLNVIWAFLYYADDEISHRKDVKKASLNMWKRFVNEAKNSPDTLEWYL